MSTVDIHIEKATHAHKDQPSKSLEQYCRHDKAINVPKDDHCLDKKKGVKTLQELMEWDRVFTTISGKTKEGSEIWMQTKILEGVAATIIDPDLIFNYISKDLLPGENVIAPPPQISA